MRGERERFSSGGRLGRGERACWKAGKWRRELSVGGTGVCGGSGGAVRSLLRPRMCLWLDGVVGVMLVAGLPKVTC